MKVHLVLEDSITADFGIVKDCHGCTDFIPADAETVGTWMKYGEGTIWLALETTIEAQQDKLVQIIKDSYVGKQKSTSEPKPKRAKKEKIATPIEKDVFEELRNMFKKRE